MELVSGQVGYGLQGHRTDLQSNLHDTITGTDNLITASVELSNRRRQTQALREIMLITLARCWPHLSPDEILAAASQVAGGGR